MYLVCSFLQVLFLFSNLKFHNPSLIRTLWKFQSFLNLAHQLFQTEWFVQKQHALQRFNFGQYRLVGVVWNTDHQYVGCFFRAPL